MRVSSVVMNNRCDGDTVALCPLHHIALIKSVSRLSDWHRVCPSTHSIHFCSSSSSTNLLTNLLSQSVFSLSVCAQSYKKELHFLALFAAPNAKKMTTTTKKKKQRKRWQLKLKIEKFSEEGRREGLDVGKYERNINLELIVVTVQTKEIEHN